MKQIVNEFLQKLKIEEDLLCEKLSKDSCGMFFFTAIKEFDLYYYNIANNVKTNKFSVNFYIIRLGMPRFIQQIFNNIPNFKVPIITFSSPHDMSKASISMVEHFGCLENGKRMSYAAMAGECDISKINDKFYEFSLPRHLYNYEEYENLVEEHYSENFKTYINSVFKERIKPLCTMDTIKQKLTDNVYVFRDKFMGYNADPILDDYFFTLAYSEFISHEAFDAFDHNLIFGGVQYRSYIIAIIFILSLAAKHTAFCEALIEKNKDIVLRDIITISETKGQFIYMLKEAVNSFGSTFEEFIPISDNDAKIIYKTLSIRRDNAHLLNNGFGTIPFLIEFSDTSIVKSIAGAWTDPSQFFLESLRHNFPSEYDHHQKEREVYMQRNLEGVLNDNFSDLKFLKNVNISKDGKIITDIDFIAIDTTSKTAFLFQLKHQDEYGSDIKKRSNRGLKLKIETEKWLEKINEWINCSDRKKINSTLQLKNSVHIDNFYTIAVAKNFAHFLSPLSADINFTYATWYQFYDATMRITSEQGDLKTLKGLFNVLREYMSHNKIEPDLSDSHLYILNKVKYGIKQIE